MIYTNPNSKRENPFRRIYDSDNYKSLVDETFPYIVDIELTNHCNLNCIFCGQQTMKRKKGYMSTTLFEQIVDECAYHKTPIRLIRWGEPFLHPKIIKFVEYAKSKGVMTHITNNGLAITEKQMQSLVDIGLDSLIFSFQGATKEQYEIMRDNTRYNELESNIMKMVSYRGINNSPFIHVSTTVTNESPEEINKFVKYWGNIVDSVGVGKTDLSRLDYNQMTKCDKLKAIRSQETLTKQYRPCTEIYQKLSIDWDGKATCCCWDYDQYLPIGDVNNTPISQIWNYSENLDIFRTLLKNKNHKSLTLCKDCYHTYEEF